MQTIVTETDQEIELPEYMRWIPRYQGRERLQVRAGFDWDSPRRLGVKWHTISVADVVKHYATDARSFSTIRSLGNIVGDWRPIANLAQEVLDVFKIVARPALEREGEKYGMSLKG